MTHHFTTALSIDCPLEDVFAFFADAENLERITPPELGFRIVTPRPIRIVQGAFIDYQLRLFGVPFGWKTEITVWTPPHEFVDVQRRGPYRTWIHTHRFSRSATGTRIDDHVEYALPFAPIGDLAYPVVRAQVTRIFAFRELAVRRLLTPAPPAAPGAP